MTDYIFSINNVLHINEDSEDKSIVISPNYIDARKNLDNTCISSQFRVIGGIWTEDTITKKIVPHDSTDDSCYKTLTIGNYDTIENHYGLEFNILNSNANINLNASNINLGNNDANIDITGCNIQIGSENGVTTILGDLVAYSTVQETSSFFINNSYTGRNIGMYVKQENILNCNMDIARFVTSDIENTALRIDSHGRIGIGLNTESNIEAWLHIDKKNPYDILTDILRIDNIDSTSLIIKNNGNIGINTTNPITDLDVHGNIHANSININNHIHHTYPNDSILSWNFKNNTILNNSTTSNLYFNGYIVNSNLKVIDHDNIYNLQSNILFSNTSNYQTLNGTIENIHVIKHLNNYIYIDSELIVPNANVYIGITDDILFFQKIHKTFTFYLKLKLNEIIHHSHITLLNILSNFNFFQISILNGFLNLQFKNKSFQSNNLLKEFTFIHFVFSIHFDGINTNVLVYVDDIKEIDEKILNFQPFFLINNDNLKIKLMSPNDSYMTPIFIDNIQFFDRILSESEINSIKNNSNKNHDYSNKYILNVDGDSIIHNSFVINNGFTNKISFASGGIMYANTNSLSLCSLGINIKWSNNLTKNIDVQTFIFKIKCNFYVCTSHPDNIFSCRTFSAFINPKDGSTVSILDSNDTISNKMKFENTVIQKNSDSSIILYVNFYNRDNEYNNMRGYFDCDLLVSTELGFFNFETFYNLEGIGFIPIDT